MDRISASSVSDPRAFRRSLRPSDAWARDFQNELSGASAVSAGGQLQCVHAIAGEISERKLSKKKKDEASLIFKARKCSASRYEKSKRNDQVRAEFLYELRFILTFSRYAPVSFVSLI